MSAYSQTVTALNSFWSKTVGVVYSGWTGKPDPWQLSNIVEDSVQSQVRAAQISCAAYDNNPQGPVPSYCDPNSVGRVHPDFEAQVRAGTLASVQAVAQNGDQSQCSSWDIWCLLQNSAGWKFLAQYAWLVPVLIIAIIFLAFFSRGLGEGAGAGIAAKV